MQLNQGFDKTETYTDMVVTTTSATICDLVSQYARYVSGKQRSTCLPWAEMTQEQQNKFKSVVIASLSNPPKSARESHDRWMISRVSDGWVYGIKASAELKQHPNIVHWELLPPEEQFKDAIFSSLILSAYSLLK